MRVADGNKTQNIETQSNDMCQKIIAADWRITKIKLLNTKLKKKIKKLNK